MWLASTLKGSALNQAVKSIRDASPLLSSKRNVLHHVVAEATLQPQFRFRRKRIAGGEVGLPFQELNSLKMIIHNAAEANSAAQVRNRTCPSNHKQRVANNEDGVRLPMSRATRRAKLLAAETRDPTIGGMRDKIVVWNPPSFRQCRNQCLNQGEVEAPVPLKTRYVCPGLKPPKRVVTTAQAEDVAAVEDGARDTRRNIIPTPLFSPVWLSVSWIDVPVL